MKIKICFRPLILTLMHLKPRKYFIYMNKMSCMTIINFVIVVFVAV